MSKRNTRRSNDLTPVIWLSLLTAALDALAAILLSLKTSPAAIFLSLKTQPAIIFKYIASGVFGSAAFNGGTEMVIAGIIFHYLTALLFTTVFYVCYPAAISILKNKYVTAIVYGGMAWVIMNLIVIPLSKIGPHHIKPLSVVISASVLMICVALPVVLVADRKNRY